MNKFDFRSLHLNLSGLKMRLIMFVGAMLVVIISVIAVINYISLSSAITDTVNAADAVIAVQKYMLTTKRE